MLSARALSFSLSFSLTAGLTLGCIPGVGGGGGGGGDVGPTVEDDIAEYEALRAQLEAARTVFIEGPAQDFAVAGDTFYWIDAAQGNPYLRSYDEPSGTQLLHGFNPYFTHPSAPNPIDNLNFSVSEQLIGSMNEPESANLYAALAESDHVAKVVLPTPPYEAKWWPYCVAGGDLYVAVIVGDRYEVQKWVGGAEPFTTVAVLDDLIGPNILGELWGIAVSGNTLAFNEGGRVWLAEIGEPQASWIKNELQLLSVSFDATGAIYPEGDDFIIYDRASDTRQNVGEAIRSGYQLNATFAHAHYPSGGAWYGFERRSIYYIGQSGLFRFDIKSGAVQPLLLDARDNSVVYRDHVVLEGGTVFVKALESTSGATGADGPTYRL